MDEASSYMYSSYFRLMQILPEPRAAAATAYANTRTHVSHKSKPARATHSNANTTLERRQHASQNLNAQATHPCDSPNRCFRISSAMFFRCNFISASAWSLRCCSAISCSFHTVHTVGGVSVTCSNCSGSVHLLESIATSDPTRN